MLVYLTGNIDGVTTIELFRKIEIELIRKGLRVNNVINVSAKDDIEYRRKRIKNVIKADKVIIIENNLESNDTLQEHITAEYIGIPVEYYDKDKY
jgi:hypothetical protein